MSLEFEPTPLAGLLLVRPHTHTDERGSFLRFFGDLDFAAAHIDFRPRQVSASRNPRPLTLRGMHWQAEPHGERKLVRVTRGRAFDVAIDLRAKSATRGRWFGCELTGDNELSMFIPRGFAHGFLTLSPDTEVSYLIEGDYSPSLALGARFDDPAFAIQWPAQPRVMSSRDASWPPWTG